MCTFSHGPTTSRTYSSLFKANNFAELTQLPDYKRLVPFSLSESAFVSGIRSTTLSTRTITK